MFRGVHPSARGRQAAARWCTMILFLGLLAIPAASTADLRFQRIGVAEGLSQATILCIHEGVDGFLWFCTQEGLNRFDGHRFRVFRRSETTGLGDSYIDDVAPARGGGLWVGTGYRGLYHFDPTTERFEPVPLFDGPQTYRVQDLHVAPDGVLWVATESVGLWRYDPEARAAQQFLAEADVLTLLADPTGTLWIGTFDRGLWRLPPAATEPVLVAPEPTTVNALLLATDETLWAGSATGVERYDPATAAPLPLTTPIVEGVSDLFLDSRTRLWVATDSGLYLRDEPGGEWAFHTHRSDDPYSLSESAVGPVIEDRQGNIWIGSWLAGANLLRAQAGPLSLLDPEDTDGAAPNDAATGVVEDLDGRIWGAFYRGVGLAWWDEQARRWVPVPTGGGGAARVLALDPQTGRIFSATNGGGLAYVERGATTATALPEQPLLDRSPESLYVHEGRIYAAMVNEGLVVLDAASGALLDTIDRSDGLPGDYVQTTRFIDGHQWIGTTQGLAWLDPGSGEIQTLTADSSGLSHNAITALHPGADGTLWVGTQGGGLNRLTPSAGGWDIAVIDTSSGLESDSIGGIEADGEGNLWVSTSLGVTRLTPAGALRSFGPGDGLPVGGFFIGSHDRGPSGHLYFGGSGVLRVDPRAYRLPPEPPEVVVTDLRIRNQPIEVSPDGRFERTIARADRVELLPDDVLVTFAFAALRPDFATDLRYRYRIPSLDPQWILTGPRGSEATFSNLPYGERQLEVAASFDGVRWGPVHRLELLVRSPWWRRPGALAFFAALLALSLAVPIRLQLQKRRERRRHQAAIAHSEQRLRSALWGSADELWYFDAERDVTQLTYFDPERQAFVDRESAGPTDSAGAVHPDDVEGALQALQDHIEGRTDTVETVFRGRTATGEWHWYQVRGTAVERGPDGRPVLVAGTRRDIDRRMTAMLALEELNLKLEEKVAARTVELERARDVLVQQEKMAALGALVAGVAHELNTPIGNALTLGSHLRDRLAADDSPTRLGPTVRDGLDLIIRDMQRAAGLIQSFKRIAIRQSSPRIRTFPLLDYLETLLESLQPIHHGRCRLQIDCPEELRLRADPAVLDQIVQNLVANSVTHGFDRVDDPCIRINVRAGKSRLILDFEDNGPGIDPEIRERIFEPFVTTARAEGATGLGMHIVFNLVTQALGGSIELREPDGGGAGFRLRLPLALVAAPAES